MRKDATEAEEGEYEHRYVVDFIARETTQVSSFAAAGSYGRRGIRSAHQLLCTIAMRGDMAELEMFSVVALLQDVPAKRLKRGQAGTIVEDLAPGGIRSRVQ